MNGLNNFSDMKFRTEMPLLPFKGLIDHQSKIIAIGSCFSENIGTKLADQQFNILVNPFGILFNPVSILNILKGDVFESEHVIEANSGAVSLDFHSKFRSESVSEFEDLVNNTSNRLQDKLSHSNILALTFGTAWAYKVKSTGRIIANCQKQNANRFEKQFLDVDNLKSQYLKLFSDLFKRQPKLKVILTVSPVRHIKDGIVENMRSKAALILLSQYLSQEFPENVIYYPAYEILMDDLRDYRFYNSDLIHPNGMAVDYIYEHFKASFFSEKTFNVISIIDKYNNLKNHRFLFADEVQKDQHKTKIRQLEVEIAQLLSVD